MSETFLHLETFGAFETLGMRRRVSPRQELVTQTAELYMDELVTAGTTNTVPGTPFRVIILGLH